MAGKITIQLLDLPQSPAPTGNQTFSVYYKLATQPATSYVTFTTSLVVLPSGVPVSSPLPQITGLASGVLYNVMFVNNCGSPSPYWVENITPL